MASVKERMAALKKANNSPVRRMVPIDSGRGRTPPRKLDIGLINKIAVATPGSGIKKNERKISPGPRPKPIDLRPLTPTRKSLQEQAGISDRAKAALVAPPSTPENQDWDLLYDLAIRYDRYKQQEAEEGKNPTKPSASARSTSPKPHQQGDKGNIKNALESALGGSVGFTANGSFLTEEYIGKYLVENKQYKSLAFDYGGQNKLFKKFERKDDEQKLICTKFVDALLAHPLASRITILDFANTMLPDAFLEALSKKCLESPGKHLPELQVLNLETNLLAKDGIIAMSDAIEHPDVWKKLQILKLENQRKGIVSSAEEALGVAVLTSPSLVVVGCEIRGGLEKQQIANTIKQNMDNLRLARRKNAKKAGQLKERKRNDMEIFFDRIAANDPGITEVDLVGDIKFLGLNTKERTKTGAAFAGNTHVKTVKMVKLKLDDAFAEEFGESLAANHTLVKVILDSNAFSGVGLKSLFAGLGTNESVVEFQVRHQSKTTSSSDEEAIPGLLESNRNLTKLGVDLRNQMVKMQVDRTINATREHQRKMRAATKKK